MIFTIDARVRFSPDFWKLQLDGSWRLVKDPKEINEKTDWTTKDISEVEKYIRTNPTVKLGAKVYSTEPDDVVICPDDIYVYFDPTVHRLSKPHRFTMDEMKKIIREGVDDRNNVLTLDLKGFFSLLEFNPDVVHSIRIAVRPEAFVAGNGYVGPEAASDEHFVVDAFRRMLSGWVGHLKSGKVNWFMDYPIAKTIEELWQELDELASRLS